MPADNELSTAWARHKAIMNYEKFHNETFGENLEGTPISVISNSSLGIEGWALNDFGEDKNGEETELNKIPSTKELIQLHENFIEKVAERIPKEESEASWNSELEISDLKSMEGRSEEEATAEDEDEEEGLADSEGESWTKVATRRWGGKGNTLHAAISEISEELQTEELKTEELKTEEPKTKLKTKPKTAKPVSQKDMYTGKHKCMCMKRNGELFCSSMRCRNDVSRRTEPQEQQQSRHQSTRVIARGSTTIGHVGTDEGSPRNTITTTRSKTHPQPKPSDQQDFEQIMKSIPEIMKQANHSTNAQILDAIQKASEIVAKKKKSDYWMSNDGQAELHRMIDDRAQKPSECANSSIFMFDYSQETKAMLSSAGAAGESEWVEVELTADTGACDTVMPRSMATHIPIQPSLQSLKSMSYEIADGNTIPNLGERRCVMWTENATTARKINLQVADVHKPLSSLSRCADMGFESRFGRIAGALIDEETGEVVPLQRKGNLYVLKCWLKAAPFGRQDR